MGGYAPRPSLDTCNTELRVIRIGVGRTFFSGNSQTADDLRKRTEGKIEHRAVRVLGVPHEHPVGLVSDLHAATTRAEATGPPVRHPARPSLDRGHSPGRQATVEILPR